MIKLTAQEKERYHRHLILDEIGVEGQMAIKQSGVLVVGAGGLGCPLIQYLTSSGVGHITIVDDDRVDLSNLQRQVFYNTTHLGQAKSLIAAKQMRQLNEQITVDYHITRMTYDNIRPFVNRVDVVVDCTDNLNARYVINDACILEKRPMVHAAVYKTQGQLSVFNYMGGPSYRCLHPRKAAEVSESGPVTGIYSVLPGILGLMQANETLKVILKSGDILSGKMMLYNAFTQSVDFIGIEKNPDNFVPQSILKNFQTAT